jgi:hypothetical protein
MQTVAAGLICDSPAATKDPGKRTLVAVIRLGHGGCVHGASAAVF